MKKEEKIKIIKWYIKNNCGLGKIQTQADHINDIKALENLVMLDKSYSHYSTCCTCWYGDRDYNNKCFTCKDGDNYIFPYGYWKKFYEKDTLK